MKDIQSILRATLIALIALGSLSCSTGSGGGGEDEKPPLTQVATPSISLAGGVFAAPQSATLLCATDGATIRYTLTGSTPTETSPEYTGAIDITTTETLTAKAWKDGITESETATAYYVISATPALELSFEYGTTPTGAGNNVYAIWLKDKNSAYTQQLQACDKANDDIFATVKPLSGTALPYWTTKIVPDSTFAEIDAVSGPTEQKKAFTVARVLARPDIRKFTVYVEHDQSWDKNDWFLKNEPAVRYEVDVDLDHLQAEYTLQARGWTIGEDTLESGNMQFTLPSSIKMDVGTFVDEIRYISMKKSGSGFGVPDTGSTAIKAVKKITVKIK